MAEIGIIAVALYLCTGVLLGVAYWRTGDEVGWARLAMSLFVGTCWWPLSIYAFTKVQSGDGGGK